MPASLVLKGLKICTPDKILPNSAVAIDTGKITAVGENLIGKKVLEFSPNWFLIPGMIDLHVHGAAGADVMDATPEALRKMCEHLVKEGVTAFLPTTMTAAPEQIEQALGNIKRFLSNETLNHGAEVLGINLEGPFLSAHKVGAQSPQYLLEPDIGLLTKWQKYCDGHIKVATIAPELPHANEFIKYLRENKIIPSMGHTEATYAQALDAIGIGCTQATHLFNAMPSIHHREPGAVLAVLLDERITPTIIVDGVHLHPAVVQMIIKLKGFSNVLLITDAMRAKHLTDGEYELGGQKVLVRNGEARLLDGTLAGSCLTMDQALRNVIKFTDCSLLDALKMVSENPARHVGVWSNKGSIEVDKDADLVVLDEKLQVKMTFCKGFVTNLHNTKSQN